MSRAAWWWAFFAGVGIADTAFNYGFGPAVMAAACCVGAFFAGLVAIPHKPGATTRGKQ